MLSLFNIFSIALYEIKNLTRSWFFRIFSVLSLVILVLINVGFYGIERSPMMLRALPSYLPYLNILLLNIVQAIIGGFMASDFMKYDKKLDTTDVVYMRSMTNADYVFGKTLGVLVVFGGLNVVALINSFVFNVFIADMPFLPALYGIYPLIISLPTLLFIFGLSFMLMSILQSQAITFVILLGYIASTLFFLGNKFNYIFDYLAFNLPLTYSDFVGFGNIHTILIHRGIYFLLGLGFIFTTVLLLKRLPQSRIISIIVFIGAICSFSTAVVLGGIYLSELSTGKNLRKEMSELNKKQSESPKVSIKSCVLDLKHEGSTINVQADLIFSNETPVEIEKYIFSLNPGLEISEVIHNGNEIQFERSLHILAINPPEALEQGVTDSLTITYHGTIDDDACYPEIDESMREASFRFMFYNIGKQYSFITPRYVLLTTENLWYPVAGIPYGAAYPLLPEKDFIDFRLRVTTGKDLTAVSQGAVSEGENGEFVFQPEVLMPRLSLAIGNYEKHSVAVDDIDYNIFILEGHDFFSEYFPEMKNKLPEQIKNLKDEFENRIGMSYPYKRFSIVETPIQFFTYPHLWTNTQETVQPEQIFLPEKAAILFNADFGQRKYWMERMAQRGNRAMTPEEIEQDLFRSFVTSTFASTSSPFMMMRRGMGVNVGRDISLRRLISTGVPNHYGNYSVFPLYYTHSHNFSSAKWPIMTTALELFLSERIANNQSQRFRMFSGLSDEERANLELTKRNLAEILENPDDIVYANSIIKAKSLYLFTLLQSTIGTEMFNNFLDELLDANCFRNGTVEYIAKTINDRFGFDVVPYFDSFMYKEQLPAFMFSEPEAKEIIENENTLYQVTFTVTNPEPVEGLILVDFRMRGGGGGRGGGFMGRGMGNMPGTTNTDNQRYINLAGGETKEIGIILDDRPGGMTIDTFISQNIPSKIEKRIGRAELDEDAIPFNGERTIDTPVQIANPGEIIVDNESSGFEIQTYAEASFVKRLINKNDTVDEEYIGMQLWNPPRRWRTTTRDGFYGAYRHSAHYIRAGEGMNKVVWNAEIPRSGKYNVYFYISEIGMQFGRGGRGGRGDRREQPIQDFHFTIHHDDGTDEVELDIDEADEGWNLLGNYFFSEGTAAIELSDESGGRVVFADAVKWVIQE